MNPVVIIFFNRPKLLQLVMVEVAKAQPEQLFLICDGPRDGRQDDVASVTACREIVDAEINWKCDVTRIYSEVNLGCGRRISTGLSEVFKHVEKAIIIEDDCLPNTQFFEFLDQALDDYEEDNTVGAISSFPFDRVPITMQQNAPNAYFTNFWCAWGWATWRRVWQNYSYELEELEAFLISDEMHLIIGDKEIADRYANNFRLTQQGKTDSWDYQFLFLLWQKKLVTLVCREPLVKNLGFASDATHTQTLAHPYSLRAFGQIEAPRSLGMVVDRLAIYNDDQAVVKYMKSPLSFSSKLFAYIRTLIFQKRHRL